MKNQPLSSGEQSKLLIFTLLLAPSVVSLVGAIPAIFIVFGLFMMKKNKDFSSIETAVTNFKGYTWLALIGSLLSALYWGNKYFNAEESRYDDMFFGSIISSAIAFTYLILVQALFLNPLKSHREWVEVNGIFSSKRNESEVDIIKGEKLKSYSVADELLKWEKLKEDGYISEEEYNDAREKLLQRN